MSYILNDYDRHFPTTPTALPEGPVTTCEKGNYMDEDKGLVGYDTRFHQVAPYGTLEVGDNNPLSLGHTMAESYINKDDEFYDIESQ